MQMLGARGGDAGNRPQQGGGFRNNPPSQQAEPKSQSDGGFADDDIPF